MGERKKIIDKKQAVYDKEVAVRCKADKENLLRLKNRAKALKTEHTRLKKEVLKEAQIV